MFQFTNFFRLIFKNKLTTSLFLACFFNGLLWLIVVPLWQTPDEQAHFAQVAFMASRGRYPVAQELDLSEEILISEKLLGTERDNLGNNKYTFHPEYNLEYTSTEYGKYEANIDAISSRSQDQFVKKEASRYQGMYYQLGATLYQVLKSQNLFIRVFGLRFWSLFWFWLTVVVTYFIGRQFSSKALLPITLAILVGFQPMMVFANIGVSNDSIGNFVFSLFILCCLMFIRKKFRLKLFLWLLIVTIWAMLTKYQLVICLPLVLLVTVLAIFNKYKTKHQLSLIIFFGIVMCLLIISVWQMQMLSGAVFRFWRVLNVSSLVKFTQEYSLSHTYKEVMPWYWGVYKWLGVTYPRPVHRLINRLVLLSILGMFISLIRNRYRLKLTRAILIAYLIVAHIVYFGAISAYDWLSWYTSKYPLGVQGRYFFPLISATMLFLLLGWRNLFPSRWQSTATKVLGVLMMIFNYYGLYTVAAAYYDVSALSKFIVQASQYKPFFAKGVWLLTWLGLALISNTVLVYKYIKHTKQ